MDPIAHTLTGAALGESGLKRRSALGMATLMIGANLPDIDAFAMPFARHVEFRRGWTHGVLAMVVLPFVLTGIMLTWDRLVRRRGGRVPPRPLLPGQILLLAAISIVSHPLLDFLNTYGVRLLMPFSSRWFYGDALFIVDPWVLLVLMGGIVIARREAGWARQREAAGATSRDDRTAPLFPTPARAALALVALYAVAMLGSSVMAGAHVRESLRRQGITHGGFMVSPVPVNPLRRDVVVENGDNYLFGWLTILPRRFEFTGHSLPRNAGHPAARAAAATPEGRAFLAWSRFPYFVIDNGDETLVHIADLRYATDPRDSWAARTIVVRGERPRSGTVP